MHVIDAKADAEKIAMGLSITIWADGSQQSRDVVRSALPLIELGVVNVQPAPRGDVSNSAFPMFSNGTLLSYGSALCEITRLVRELDLDENSSQKDALSSLIHSIESLIHEVERSASPRMRLYLAAQSRVIKENLAEL